MCSEWCVIVVCLGGEDGFWVAGSVKKSDIELDGDVRTGWDLVSTRSSGIGMATLSPATSLQVHKLLHCE